MREFNKDSSKETEPKMKTSKPKINGRNKKINESRGNEKFILTKQRYLWILLKDIMLSSIFILSCILIGINMIVKKETHLHYGVLVLFVTWFPAVLLIPHELYHSSILIPAKNTTTKILASAIGLVLFPIIPLAMYLHLLYGSKAFGYFSRLEYFHNLKLFP